MLEVRPSLYLKTDEKIIHGVDVNSPVLQGRVMMIAEGVTIGVQPGDEVLFRRPEGVLPDVAILGQELIEAVVTYPTYGEDV